MSKVRLMHKHPPNINGDPISGIGMGTLYAPQYVSVTGGGAFPILTNAITATFPGDGATDVTSQFQTFANQAAASGVPMLLPFTNSFYKISNGINISTSLIGINGTPTIKQITVSGDSGYSGVKLQTDTTGWLYNLHIIGPWDGTQNQPGQWAFNVSCGGVNGWTIRSVIMETPIGDCIGDQTQQNTPTIACRNVWVDNCSLINAYRNGTSLVNVADRWAMTNCFIDYRSDFVNPMDLEPWHSASYVSNVEISYNKINSPGIANGVYYNEIFKIDGTFDTTPGTGVWTHHNYGTWGVPFFHQYGAWPNVNVSNNVAGQNPPP